MSDSICQILAFLCNICRYRYRFRNAGFRQTRMNNNGCLWGFQVLFLLMFSKGLRTESVYICAPLFPSCALYLIAIP